jgi:hypothetical protein
MWNITTPNNQDWSDITLGAPAVYRLITRFFLMKAGLINLGAQTSTTRRRLLKPPIIVLLGEQVDQAVLFGVLNGTDLRLPRSKNAALLHLPLDWERANS